jgi:large subunit ribosomal protein L23
MAIKQTSGITLESYQVVWRPLVTEKGTHLSTRYNKYTFQVNPAASKPEIKQAVEELFGVRVVSIRTQNRLGKPRRNKFKIGYTSDWKKAIVELHPDDRVAFF